MPGPLGMIGAQAAGAGLGLLLQGQQDRRQIRQQEKLQQLEIAGQQQMTDYNLQKQMELWERTNYKAQVEQLKKAGLNPGLIYGMGGGGGATTNVGQGHVTGGNAPSGGGEIQGIMGMGLALQQAQIENIKAQTEKTKAETTNVPLTGQNIQADTKVKEVTEANMNIANDIAGATQNAQKALILQAVKRSWEELEMVQEQNKWNEKQLQETFRLTTANIVEAYAKAQLADKQKDLTAAQIGQIAEAIKQAWSTIDINATQAQTQQQLAEFTTSMGPQAASIAGDILTFISNMFRQTTTKGKK